MKRQKIFIGELETYHFDFLSTGYTEEECRQSMRKAWRAHCRNCGVPDNWKEFEDGVNCTEMYIGEAARDGSVIYEVKKGEK